MFITGSLVWEAWFPSSSCRWVTISPSLKTDSVLSRPFRIIKVCSGAVSVSCAFPAMSTPRPQRVITPSSRPEEASGWNEREPLLDQRCSYNEPEEVDHYGLCEVWVAVWRRLWQHRSIVSSPAVCRSHHGESSQCSCCWMFSSGSTFCFYFVFTCTGFTKCSRAHFICIFPLFNQVKASLRVKSLFQEWPGPRWQHKHCYTIRHNTNIHIQLSHSTNTIFS